MPTTTPSSAQPRKPKKTRRWHRVLLLAFLCLILLVTIGRLMLPSYVRWYVNRTLDKSPVYQGTIGDIDIRLLNGGYVIHDIEINKTTGNVPVPFFSARKIDLHLEWSALLHGKFVGQIAMSQPQLNFVDASNDSSSQSGSQGPWLEMIRDLFPFKINSCVLHNGEIHFHVFDANPPVDASLNHLEAAIDNLSNIHDDVQPLITTVEASGLAMDSGRFEFHMKLNPFSYKPSFELALRLVGLDVTEINALARAYGKFDFSHGSFDLVVELNAREGALDGYVKPSSATSPYSISPTLKKTTPSNSSGKPSSASPPNSSKTSPTTSSEPSSLSPAPSTPLNPTSSPPSATFSETPSSAPISPASKTPPPTPPPSTSAPPTPPIQSPMNPQTPPT